MTAALKWHARWFVLLALFFSAVLLRFADLELKPLHHDEGVNMMILRQLVDEGVYRYNPRGYHGPTLYYFAAIPSQLLGVNVVAARLTPAIFGLGIVLMMFLLRKELSPRVVIVAAGLLLVSPGMVFHARYFIHETLFVFFTLTLVVFAIHYARKPTVLRMAGVTSSAALLFATKETAFISMGVLVIASLLANVYTRFRGRKPADVATVRQRRPVWVPVAVGFTVFVLISVLLFSSFFTYGEGLLGALVAFIFWGAQAGSDQTHPWWTYFTWLSRVEFPLLFLGVAGTVCALWRADNRFKVFTAFWTMGIVSAYSLIPYKTPWLMLNFLVPLSLMAAVALEELHRTGRRLTMFAACVFLVVYSTYQSLSLNFFRYDDESIPYVHAATSREFLGMVSRVEELSLQLKSGAQTPIAVVHREHAPLPWYLRGFDHVSYHRGMTSTSDAIVIGTNAQEPSLGKLLGERYIRVGSWKRRNGVREVVYVRR